MGKRSTDIFQKPSIVLKITRRIDLGVKRRVPWDTSGNSFISCELLVSLAAIETVKTWSIYIITGTTVCLYRKSRFVFCSFLYQ